MLLILLVTKVNYMNKTSFYTSKYFWVFTLLIFILVFTIRIIVSDIYLNELTIYSLLELIIAVFALLFSDKRKRLFSLIFILFSFFLHCAHPFLMLTGLDDSMKYDMLPFTSMGMYIYSMKLIIYVHFSVCLGSLLIAGRETTIESKSHPIGFDGNANLAKKIAIALLLVSIPFRLYSDVMKYIGFFSGGYLNSLNSIDSGFVMTLSKFFDVAIFALIISYSNKKKTAVKISILYFIYNVFLMLTGNRGYGVCCLLVVILILFKVVKIQVRFFSATCFLIIGYLLASLLITIGSYRIFGFNSNLFLSFFKVLFSGQVITDVFDEFGTTIVSVAHSIEAFPHNHNFAYGSNYFKSLALVFPNIFGFVKDISDAETYSAYFTLKHSIGGSYIGELFYSFGDFAPLFAIVIGFFLGLIDKKIDTSIKMRDYVGLIVCFVFAAPMLWWIRDYFWAFVRYVSWPLILILLLSKLFYKKPSSLKYNLFGTNID